MQPIRSFLIAGFVCLLCSCRSEPPKARAIGEAFVGPASILLRSDLSTRSDKLAELKFGEKLEILQTRRALVKVRNMGGSEGWVDGKHLLTSAQMSELKRTIDTAAAMPAQGKAKVFDALNVHTETNRQSPSPFQIPPGGTADVLARKVERRIPYRPLVQALLNAPSAPKKPRRKKGKDKQEQKEEEKA
ncbi:MAG: SH3 domain-containing protein [Bryobacterales bacterium]|nr:SH3 domain-containing protein [Bryobacterales bacterium]